MGVSGNFREFSGITGNFNVTRDITQRKNKISIHDLYQNDSTIMTDSPVEYLRNDTFDSITEKFPTLFISK